MDRYGAHGELLAETMGETCLGPFVVQHGTDQAFEIGRDGMTTIWSPGLGSRPERSPRINDERYKLTRDEWASCMADHFYDGFFHDWACCTSFFDELTTMRSDKCRGVLSPEWEAWIRWATAVMRTVAIDEQSRRTKKAVSEDRRKAEGAA